MHRYGINGWLCGCFCSARHLPGELVSIGYGRWLDWQHYGVGHSECQVESAIHDQISALLQAFIHSKMRKRMNMMMMELAQAKATFDA